LKRVSGNNDISARRKVFHAFIQLYCQIIFRTENQWDPRIGQSAEFLSLKERGLFCIEVNEKRQTSQTILSSKFSKKLKPKDLVIFCRQFNVLLMAGVTIIKVLDVIYQQTESKQIKAVVLKVYEMVQKGDLLSEAMRKQGDAFPGILINMVDSGEASGKLELVMDRMAEHFEKERKLQNKIVSSCSGKISVIYPTVEILNTCLYIRFTNYMALLWKLLAFVSWYPFFY
jgi:type II secretory pathway component PulF